MSSSRRPCRRVVAASMLAVLTVAPGIVLASDLHMTVEPPRFTCGSHGASFPHVVFRSDRRPGLPAALPCCYRQLGCAQFLSTDTVLRPSRPHRS